MRRYGVSIGLLAIVLVFPGLLALGCGSSATTTTTATSSTTLSAVPTGDFIVSAAASLKAAFTEFGGTFATKSGVTPTFNFAASGVLQKQIEGGAPVEVFASASPKQVDALTKENLVDPSTTASFAGNDIVLIVPAGSTLGITGFADLTKPEVKKITTGDPQTAPHGVSAIEVLTSLKLLDQVKPKLVYSANAAQTIDYVARGEVDAGISFFSDAKGNDKVKIIATADQTLYTPVKYVVTVVKAAKNPAAAKAFIALLLSDEGQALLATFGFRPAPK